MTLLDHAAPRASTTTPAERLRLTTAAVRVSFTWFGVRKTLTPEQKTQAADAFGAEKEYLSARKKLLDTRHDAYKAVTAIRGKVLAYWKGKTLPYPEPGIRLIRQNQVEDFNATLLEHRSNLRGAVTTLDDHYAELKAAARRRLGSLYSSTDYPPSLQGLFEIDWDFPSVEPPDYLLQLSPALYEQERARVASRFDEAVVLAEQAFLTELGKLITHLSERLSDETQGEKKIFRDSAITNLTEFFERFKQLNVRSSAELDSLVEQAQGIVQGVEAQNLRDSSDLRQHIVAEMSRVQTAIDGMIIDQPRRRIVRSHPSTNGAGHANGD